MSAFCFCLQEQKDVELPGWGSGLLVAILKLFVQELGRGRCPKEEVGRHFSMLFFREATTSQGGAEEEAEPFQQRKSVSFATCRGVYEGKKEAAKYFVDQVPYGMNPAQYNQERRYFEI